MLSCQVWVLDMCDCWVKAHSRVLPLAHWWHLGYRSHSDRSSLCLHLRLYCCQVRDSYKYEDLGGFAESLIKIKSFSVMLSFISSDSVPPVSAVTCATALLVPESVCHDVAVCWVVAPGACVVVAAGTAMGMTAELVVLIAVVSARVLISTVGTAISAIVASAVAAIVGTVESSFKQR